MQDTPYFQTKIEIEILLFFNYGNQLLNFGLRFPQEAEWKNQSLPSTDSISIKCNDTCPKEKERSIQFSIQTGKRSYKLFFIARTFIYHCLGSGKVAFEPFY